MFKTTLRKILFTTLLAGLTCATLVGINAAFGAPSEAPPGNTISPTFDNITVTSNADVAGDLTADNVEANSLVDALEMQTGQLSVSPNGSPLFQVTGAEEVVIGSAGSGPLANFVSAIETTFNNIVTLNDTLNVNAQINANNGLAVTNAGGTSLAVDGVASISDSLSVGSSTNPATTALSGTVDLYGDTTSYGTLNVGTAADNHNLVVNGNANVNGRITADQMGTFRAYSGSFKIVAPGSFGDLAETCPDGSFMVSCGGKFSDFNNDVSYSIVNSVDNKCYVGGTNTTVYDDLLQAYYVCHHPTYAIN